jgi:molybdopterin biosynthesis enzyme
VSFHLFAKPLIKKMMGHKIDNIRTIRAIASDDFDRFSDGKLHLDRGVLSVSEEGCLRVNRQAKQGSHMLRLFAESNVLICIPDGDGVKKGTSVDVIPLELSTFED